MKGAVDTHVWGQYPGHPDWDMAKCRACGLIATNASIATGADTTTGVPIPVCWA